jgi:tetratricopeptide (TPR) repeat protein
MRRVCPIVCALIVLWGSLSWATRASAAGGDEADKVETFRQHVARGAKLRKQQQHRQALEHFEKARAIADHPKLMFVTGELHEAIGDCAAARADYEQARSDKRASEALRAKLEEALANNKECESRGQLALDCSPADAQVRLGERDLLCGDLVELKAGSHTLIASAPGHRELQVEVQVEPGSQERHEVHLTELSPRKAKAVAAVPDWLTYSAYGGMGLGATLLVAGLASDASATSRQEELHQAHSRGEFERTNQLVSEAESARTRTAVLYTSGAIVAAAGGLLWVYDEEVAGWVAGDGVAAVQPQVSVGSDGASVGATIRW